MNSKYSLIALVSIFVCSSVLAQPAMDQPSRADNPPAPNLQRAAERTGLSDEQLTQVKGILQSHMESVRAQLQQDSTRPSREEMDANRERMQEQMEANRELLRAELAEILEPEQVQAVERAIQSRMRSAFEANRRSTNPRPSAERI